QPPVFVGGVGGAPFDAPGALPPGGAGVGGVGDGAGVPCVGFACLLRTSEIARRSSLLVRSIAAAHEAPWMSARNEKIDPSNPRIFTLLGSSRTASWRTPMAESASSIASGGDSFLEFSFCHAMNPID